MPPKKKKLKVKQKDGSYLSVSEHKKKVKAEEDDDNKPIVFKKRPKAKPKADKPKESVAQKARREATERNAKAKAKVGKASMRQIHDYDEAHKDLKNEMKLNKTHSDYNTSGKRKALRDKIDKKHQVAFLFKKNNPEGFSKVRKRVKETIKRHMGGMLTYGEVVQQHL